MAPTDTSTKAAGSGKAADGSKTGAEGGKQASDGPRTVLIELQRSLAGWGERWDVIEVDPADEAVKSLLANEQALRVNRRDVSETPQGLQVDDPGHRQDA